MKICLKIILFFSFFFFSKDLFSFEKFSLSSVLAPLTINFQGMTKSELESIQNFSYLLEDIKKNFSGDSEIPKLVEALEKEISLLSHEEIFFLIKKWPTTKGYFDDIKKYNDQINALLYGLKNNYYHDFYRTVMIRNLTEIFYDNPSGNRVI